MRWTVASTALLWARKEAFPSTEKRHEALADIVEEITTFQAHATSQRRLAQASPIPGLHLLRHIHAETHHGCTMLTISVVTLLEMMGALRSPGIYSVNTESNAGKSNFLQAREQAAAVRRSQRHMVH